VYGVTDAETTAQGGDYVVMGNVAQPVYVVDPPDGVGEATIAPIPMIAVDGALAMGNVAIPVYVVGGSLGGLDPVENLVLEITGADRDVITATWDAVAGATDYEIEYSDDGVTYAPVGTTALLTFDIEDTDYDPAAVVHYVRVRAVGGDDWTVASISGLRPNGYASYSFDTTGWVDAVAGANLTGFNTPTLTAGVLSNAVNLVASSSQYLTRADIPWRTLDFTIAGWFHLTSNGGAFGILGNLNGGAEDVDYCLYVNNGDVVLRRFQSNGNDFEDLIWATTLAGGTTYHFAMSYNQTTHVVSLQINAATAQTAVMVDTPVGTTDFFYVGQIGDGNLYFEGWIDQLDIWMGRVLSTAQVANHYNGGTGKAFPFTP